MVCLRFVAVAVVDMEFLAIDFNPCPKSDGNDPPNYFYNTSRCKPSTTVGQCPYFHVYSVSDWPSTLKNEEEPVQSSLLVNSRSALEANCHPRLQWRYPSPTFQIVHD